VRDAVAGNSGHNNHFSSATNKMRIMEEKKEAEKNSDILARGIKKTGRVGVMHIIVEIPPQARTQPSPVINVHTGCTPPKHPLGDR